MSSIHLQTQKDSILSAIIELIAGLFGFPGIGWIFAGKFFTGLKILLIYWGSIMVMGFGLTMVTILTLGIASLPFVVLAPITLIIYFGVPIVSAGRLYYRIGFGDKARRPAEPTPRQERVAPSIGRYILEQNQSQRQGLQGWQIAIIIGLTIIATLVLSSVGLLLYGYLNGV